MMGWTEPSINRTGNQHQNAEDYNRVEGNTEYLIELLQSMGYLLDAIQTNKTDWNSGDIDSLQHHLRIINNLKQAEFINLTGLKTLRTDLDIIPPDYQDYNDWEHNLAIINKYAQGTLRGLGKLSFKLGGDRLGT